MPSIALHTSPSSSSSRTPNNSLPTLLQTPSGLAIVEIQGTIHAPFPSPSADFASPSPTQTEIGRLEFRLYDPSTPDAAGKWMKKVYLYVGQHQRLPGEMKKLPKAIAVIRKREFGLMDDMIVDGEDMKQGKEASEELEIAEIVRWKILFAGRPEPVGGGGGMNEASK